MAARGRPKAEDVLTPAEWRVVELVRHGLSDREIAARMGVSAYAVRFHVRNARDKLGLPGRAALRHWDGIARASALRRGTGMFEGLGALGQVARSVRDIAAAEAFFRDVLGMRHLFTFGDLAFFDAGGVRLFLSAAKEGGGDGAAILYFRVADIHAARDALAARGVAFRDAPHMIHRHADGTEEWMAFFDDNEGRPLAIMSQVTPA